MFPDSTSDKLFGAAVASAKSETAVMDTLSALTGLVEFCASAVVSSAAGSFARLSAWSVD